MDKIQENNKCFLLSTTGYSVFCNLFCSKKTWQVLFWLIDFLSKKVEAEKPFQPQRQKKQTAVSNIIAFVGETSKTHEIRVNLGPLILTRFFFEIEMVKCQICSNFLVLFVWWISEFCIDKESSGKHHFSSKQPPNLGTYAWLINQHPPRKVPPSEIRVS